MSKYMLAFAGQADTTDANIEALLNDLLGYGPEDSEGLYEIPEGDESEVFFVLPSATVGDGLDKVIDWSAKASQELCILHTEGDGEALADLLEDADKVLEDEDVIRSTLTLLASAANKGFEPMLVLLYGEGDEDSEALLKAVHEDGRFPILDLTEGLDEIEWAPGEDDVEPEPEPEPEEKPKRRSRAKDYLIEGQTTVDEQVAEAEAETPDLPHDRNTGSRDFKGEYMGEYEGWIRQVVREEIDAAMYVLGARIAQFAAAGNTPVASAPAPEAAQEAELGGQDTPEASEGLSEPPKRRRGGGRPRKDGSPAVPVDEQKFPFVQHEDGTLTKRGRGKPRKGTVVVELTLAEAREQGWEED